MNGELREAKLKLKEMAMKHDMSQADCYNNIRHLSIIMLALYEDMNWVKYLMFLILIAVLGMQGVGMVI